MEDIEEKRDIERRENRTKRLFSISGDVANHRNERSRE